MSRNPVWRARHLLISLALVAACAGPQVFDPGRLTVEEAIAPGMRILWVGAHPDDETMAGPLLAKACLGNGNACQFAVMNRGGGGECLLPEGCEPDLETVRTLEVERVAELYGAQIEVYDYFNASLPVTSFPDRDEIGRRWIEAGDPADRLGALIRRFRPTTLVTFDPDHGFTCHPEHQLAARFAFEAVRRAADPDRDFDGLPTHRVEHSFSVLNRHWLIGALMGKDPGPYTDEFDPDQACNEEESCFDVANRISHAHETQAGDMGRARFASNFVYSMYLARAEPWSERLDPLDPAPGWCE